jgi:hypothetical protein
MRSTPETSIAIATGATIGTAFFATAYLLLPPVRALTAWQWHIFAQHPVLIALCALGGLALGYYTDQD